MSRPTEICDSCSNAAYDQLAPFCNGQPDHDSIITVAVDLGADIEDHYCDTSEVTELVCDCACSASARHRDTVASAQPEPESALA